MAAKEKKGIAPEPFENTNYNMSEGALQILAKLCTPSGAELLSKFASETTEADHYYLYNDHAHNSARAAARVSSFGDLYSDFSVFKQKIDKAFQDRKISKDQPVNTEQTNHAADRHPEE